MVSPSHYDEAQGSTSNTKKRRRLDSESWIKALQDQISDAKVPNQLEKIKDLLLSILHNLEPDRKENEETISSFVERIVQLSMTILLLLEATDGMSHTRIEGLQQVLEDVKNFVISANRWHSYPCSISILRKTLSSKTEALERRLNSILNGLEASLSDVQPEVAETPMEGISTQICNRASSNLFANASDFIMENPNIYSAPGGSIHLVTNHAREPPLLEGLELEREIYKRREYRLHRGRAHGRAVVVKVFRGPRANQLCLDTAGFYRNLIHSNVLRMIGDPVHDSKAPFLVFDGDYVGTVESQLAIALKEGNKEAWIVGANTVIGCSLGMDYLEELGLPFGLMKPEHFILMVSRQGKVVVDFDADAKWDHTSNSNQWTTSQSHKTRKIFNELIEKTFYTSCKEYYRDQRLYTDNDAAAEAFIDNDDDVFDKDDDEPERRSPDPDQGALIPGSASGQSLRKARGHRRELVWKSRSVTSVSLEAIGQHYEASLARFHSENMLVHRWSHSMTQVAHRCKGYKRTEITLTPDIKRSGIVSHTSPVPNEICSVCGEKVGMAEIFDCSCGLANDDNTTITLPTVKCTICSRWQHQACMKITSDTQIKRFICWRCPGGIVNMRLPPITVIPAPLSARVENKLPDRGSFRLPFLSSFHFPSPSTSVHIPGIGLPPSPSGSGELGVNGELDHFPSFGLRWGLRRSSLAERRVSPYPSPNVSPSVRNEEPGVGGIGVGGLGVGLGHGSSMEESQKQWQQQGLYFQWPNDRNEEVGGGGGLELISAEIETGELHERYTEEVARHGPDSYEDGANSGLSDPFQDHGNSSFHERQKRETPGLYGHQDPQPDLLWTQEPRPTLPVPTNTRSQREKHRPTSDMMSVPTRPSQPDLPATPHIDSQRVKSGKGGSRRAMERESYTRENPLSWENRPKADRYLSADKLPGGEIGPDGGPFVTQPNFGQ